MDLIICCTAGRKKRNVQKFCVRTASCKTLGSKPHISNEYQYVLYYVSSSTRCMVMVGFFYLPDLFRLLLPEIFKTPFVSIIYVG